MNQLPILYSFRRCPYAIRARMAIAAAGIRCELREVLLKEKPAQLLEISPKGTVQVVDTADEILEESLAIMQWALAKNDPHGWLEASIDDPLIKQNDGEFKHYLDRYKYFDRYPENSQAHYLEKACEFFDQLEAALSKSAFLRGDSATLVDAAIFPFVRQCCMVDQKAFARLKYTRLQLWLENWLSSQTFQGVMSKYPFWKPGDTATYFSIEPQSKLF